MVMDRIWQQLQQNYGLHDAQIEAYQEYHRLLAAWNGTRMNLTAMTAVHDVVPYHFEDSLALAKLIDPMQVGAIADVGSGAGFPGLVLKIAYPHLRCLLIEVQEKRRLFLQEVIQKLQLSECEVCPLDWRTFLRSTNGLVDLFLARASLRPDELLRAFASYSAYRHAKIIYWAAQTYTVDHSLRGYCAAEMAYQVGDKKRKLVLLENAASGHCSSVK